MKVSRTIAFILATAITAPAAAYAIEETATPVVHHVHHRHHAASAHKTAPELATAAPAEAKPVPRTAVQNNSDGLSTDPEDCNKGCLGDTE